MHALSVRHHILPFLCHFRLGFLRPLRDTVLQRLDVSISKLYFLDFWCYGKYHLIFAHENRPQYVVFFAPKNETLTIPYFWEMN